MCSPCSEKRVGMKMFSKDVFLNFAGGFKVADPGLDLAVTGSGDLLLLRSSDRRRESPGGRNRLVGRSAPRPPYGTAYQRSCPARVQTDRRVGLPGPFRSKNPKVSKSSRSTASTNCRVPCSRKDRQNSRYLLKTCTRSPDDNSSGHYFWYFPQKGRVLRETDTAPVIQKRIRKSAKTKNTA